MTKSVNNLWWTNATPEGELLRLPHIPDLNVSRLPWLQAAPAKGLLARRHRAPVTSGGQDRGQNKDRHESLRMGDSKVHNRFLAISRDGRHGDDEMRQTTTKSINNL